MRPRRLSLAVLDPQLAIQIAWAASFRLMPAK